MIAAYRPSSTTPSNAHNHAAISLQFGMMTSSSTEMIEVRASKSVALELHVVQCGLTVT
jgi:hypothetical protein